MDPEGEGAGGPDPLPENHKLIGFLSNNGPDILKNHRAAEPAFNLAFCWWADDGPFQWYLDPDLDPLSPHQLS